MSMKLLALADLHGDFNLLKGLVERAVELNVDLVIIAGDLTQFEAHLDSILKRLDSIGKPIFIIPGNHEDDLHLREVAKPFKNIICFNKQAVKFKGYVLLGYGEGGFSIEDCQFSQLARQWYGEYQNQKIILVLHGPPFATALDRIDHRHIGNKDFRKFIDRIQPQLVICGHLHENAGKNDKIGATYFVNPGWEGAVIEIS